MKCLSQDDDLDFAMINATIVRPHQHSAGSKKEHNQAIERSFLGMHQNSCTV
ncbi:hypothetical protein [Holospora obtusa]|uniref:hypothetical protein n=1 Tax=Holospora obtusa TaxID=49893 RepID=UPI0012EC729C|nr:hypothetical protein [Holospora obtusa]